MLHKIVAVFIFLAACGRAVAQPVPLVAGGIASNANLSAGVTTATGGNTALSQAARAAQVVNVKDFGAVCNGSTDDAAAFNAAFTFARNLTNDPTGAQTVKIFFPYGSCVVKSSINATGFTTAYQVFIEGAGSVIYGQTTGTPVIDALSSRFLHFNNVSIYGASSSTPNIGIQIGRISTASADEQTFDGVTINGNFTFASLFNLASETVRLDGLILRNSYSGGGSCFGLVQDGMNHWNASSAFVTETIAVDTQQSFNENTFLRPIIQTSSCIPIWVGNTSRHSFIGGYSSTSAANAVDVWTGSGTGINTELHMDVHFETTAITDTFLFTGTATSPIMFGFLYRDQLNSASNSVFKLDTGLAAMDFRDADVEIASYSTTPVLFAQPTLWSFSGKYASTVATQFNAPSLMEGSIATAYALRGAYYGTAAAYSLQNPDSTAVGGNVRGNNAVDLQINRASASQVASGVESFIGGGSGNTASNTFSIAFGNLCQSGGFSSFCAGVGLILSGEYSAGFGDEATDRGSTKLLFSAGDIATRGDAQIAANVLRGFGTSTTIRLLDDTNSAGSTNCVNIPINTVYSLSITLVASDRGNPAINETWLDWGGLMTAGATASTTAVTMQSTPTPLSNGTVTGSTISATADTTNGCLNLSFTTPTSNTDLWHVVANVQTIEVQ